MSRHIMRDSARPIDVPGASPSLSRATSGSAPPLVAAPPGHASKRTHKGRRGNQRERLLGVTSRFDEFAPQDIGDAEPDAGQRITRIDVEVLDENVRRRLHPCPPRAGRCRTGSDTTSSTDPLEGRSRYTDRRLPPGRLEAGRTRRTCPLRRLQSAHWPWRAGTPGQPRSNRNRTCWRPWRAAREPGRGRFEVQRSLRRRRAWRRRFRSGWSCSRS